jgi:hypothetical protein
VLTPGVTKDREHICGGILIASGRLQWAAVVYHGILFGGRFQQIQLKTEGRENGDLGAVAP